MTCIAIDDEPLALSIVEEYIGKTPFLQYAGGFRSAVQALEVFRKQPVDLVFCDINMPDLNGLQVARHIGPRAKIIFTTAYSEHALVGYELDVVDYLLKPIEFDRFLKAAEKALRLHELQQATQPTDAKAPPAEALPERAQLLRIKSGTQYHQIPIDDILYLEAEGNYVAFVLPGKKILSLMTMAAAEQTLPADRFVRVHKSFIVARQHVGIIQAHEIQIKGAKIPIGKSYRQLVKNVFGL
jgi:DNA-binding LytR/AlgR family response regulator